MKKLRYAVHAYAWTPSWSNDTLDLIDRAKGLGFDMIEVPLMEIEKVDAAAIRQRCRNAGMDVCASVACSERTDPTGEDQATRDAALAFLRKCIQATADMGGKVLTGVIYSAIGRRIDHIPGPEYWDRSAKILQQAARYAADLGLLLGLEPINRYESFLVNTCKQALTLKDMIGEPNVRVHLDAYHMNIEETDFFSPTLEAAPHLCHYHLSESHRGTVGTGVVNWDQIYRALAEAKYQGVVGMESFIEPSPAMAAATCIWRRLADSTDPSLAQGLKYLKAMEAKHYK